MQTVTPIRKYGASFARGQSRQDYCTPPEFLAAVKKRFRIDGFEHDLAATVENTVAKHFFCDEENSLVQDWTRLLGNLWLNPPFGTIAPWAKKCAECEFQPAIFPSDKEQRIFFLVPAAVGSNWWRDFVHDKSCVLFLNGRLSFDGKNPYPKDCALCVYGEKPGYECWRWKS